MAMVMKMQDWIARLVVREPRAMIGGSILSCIIAAELVVAVAR